MRDGSHGAAQLLPLPLPLPDLGRMLPTRVLARPTYAARACATGHMRRSVRERRMAAPIVVPAGSDTADVLQPRKPRAGKLRSQRLGAL